MTALDRILAKMQDDLHRQSFVRLMAEAGLKEDSPDLVFLSLDHEARWSAVEAMADERERIERMLADLPEAMRAAGAEIAQSIGGEVGRNTSAALVTTLKGAMDEHLAALRSDREAERREDLERLDKIVREAQATHQTSRRGIADVQGAANETATKTIAHADHIASQVRGLHERARVVAYAVVAAVALGSVGAGTAGALIERHLDHDSTYAHGWSDGAAAVRAHMHH